MAIKRIRAKRINHLGQLDEVDEMELLLAVSQVSIFLKNNGPLVPETAALLKELNLTPEQFIKKVNQKLAVE